MAKVSRKMTGSLRQAISAIFGTRLAGYVFEGRRMGTRNRPPESTECVIDIPQTPARVPP